jgi:hypothetical protein
LHFYQIQLLADHATTSISTLSPTEHQSIGSRLLTLLDRFSSHDALEILKRGSHGAASF